jgi:aminocarboxymuconate-semialdehyde decarboxylase
MNSRRDFFKSVAGATAGMYVMGSGRAAAQARRQVSIAGKRVRVVDVHAHTDVPLGEVVKGTKWQNEADNDPELEERIPLMDKQGVDVQALSINGFWWYEITDRGLARAVCTRQNEELARWVKRCRSPTWRLKCSRRRSPGWARAA